MSLHGMATQKQSSEKYVYIISTHTQAESNILEQLINTLKFYSSTNMSRLNNTSEITQIC